MGKEVHKVFRGWHILGSKSRKRHSGSYCRKNRCVLCLSHDHRSSFECSTSCRFLYHLDCTKCHWYTWNRVTSCHEILGQTCHWCGMRANGPFLHRGCSRQVERPCCCPSERRWRRGWSCAKIETAMWIPSKQTLISHQRYSS